jgi:hypothetical protein
MAEGNIIQNPDYEVRQLTRTKDLGNTLFDNRGRQYDRLSGASYLNTADTRTPTGVPTVGAPVADRAARTTSPSTRYTGSGRNWRGGSPTGLPGNAYYPTGKFTGKVASKVGETIGKTYKAAEENGLITPGTATSPLGVVRAMKPIYKATAQQATSRLRGRFGRSQ